MRPSRVVYRVHFPPWSRARPPPSVPIHYTPSLSTLSEEMSSLGRPFFWWNEVNWPSRRRFNPPPPRVPIQRLPSASSAIAVISLFDSPSRVVNLFHSFSSQRTSP